MSKKILVVDDIEGLRDALKEFLEGVGEYTVVVASDGADAIEVATKERPDLVLLDIKLPVIDGFEVLEQLKKREIETRVIMFTQVYYNVETVVKCIRNGACDFIFKPFTLSDILEHIKKNLLIETTLNLRVSNPAPFVELLIKETEKLKKENSRLGKENSLMGKENIRLSKRVFVAELVMKTIYVMLALGAILLLNYFQIASGTVTLVLAFVLLMVLLMVPIDRIQSITTGLKQFKAKIALK
ncbi:MAG: response regulator [Nitrospira sp.]|nr:response regulator [Nitrospira sp.]